MLATEPRSLNVLTVTVTVSVVLSLSLSLSLSALCCHCQRRALTVSVVLSLSLSLSLSAACCHCQRRAVTLTVTLALQLDRRVRVISIQPCNLQRVQSASASHCPPLRHKLTTDLVSQTTGDKQPVAGCSACVPSRCVSALVAAARE